jgi:RimJ/RimL family protein N-acetyltransferase
VTDPFILKTKRLILRELCQEDDAFMFRLMNGPSWIKFVGDRGIASVGHARTYLNDKLIPAYRDSGFGFYLVESKVGLVSLGICGFVKRDFLEHPDLGFAFLSEHWRQGYAFESSKACLEYGRRALGFSKIAAITSPDNDPSDELLLKLGFYHEGVVEDDEGGEQLFLYSSAP